MYQQTTASLSSGPFFTCSVRRSTWYGNYSAGCYKYRRYGPAEARTICHRRRMEANGVTACLAADGNFCVTADARARAPAAFVADASHLDAAAADELRSDFIRVLRSRRLDPDVPLKVELAKPVTNPTYQGSITSGSQNIMEGCPKENIENFKDRIIEENIYLTTEGGEQGCLPVIILSMKESKPERKPAIIFLHSSYKCKEWLRPLLEAYASRGYVSIAIDSRYHGERAKSATAYKDALISSWKQGDTMPFIFDTVWDLIKLADYLVQREDIDPARIGITGESLGGMHAWFAAAADTRYSVVVPIIGVQGFMWALDENQWQARVDSIKPVFEEARADILASEIDKELVKKVWDKIAPGLASKFDSPYTIPLIAPRSLLIINGKEDPRCPFAGLETTIHNAFEAYKKANCPDKFKVIAEPGIGHQMTESMVLEASKWFDKFLK